MNSSDFKRLADVRIVEAKVLMDQRKYDGAYYLAGHAIECALKARIAKATRRHEFPDKKFATKCFTHNVEDLLNVSGLAAQLRKDASADPNLAANWLIVKDWNEESRYKRSTRVECLALYGAIINHTHGILPWLKRHW